MNNNSIIKVLLLEGYLIQTQSIAKSLYRSGYYVIIFCEEKWSYGYHTKYAKERHLTESCETEPDKYYERVLDYIKHNVVGAIIPMSDESAKLLAEHQDEISLYSSVSAPRFSSFREGYDKNELMKLCARIGANHPFTVDLVGNFDIKGLNFPAIIKPNITSGGRGMCIVHTPDELRKMASMIIAKYGPAHAQEFIPSGGRQIKVQILINRNGEMVCSSVMCKKRWYPVNGGSSCCNITIEEPKLVEQCYELLRSISWRGFADFDVIEDPRDNSLKIMEINPRVPACIKSAIISGIDWGEIIVNDIRHLPQKTYNYSPGKVLRFLGFDVLWFLKSPRRFSSKPSWFLFFGKNVSYQDLDISDLGSFFWGTLGNIKKLMSSETRKSKAGLN